MLLVLLAMVAVFSFLRPDTFFTVGNFTSLANSQAVLLILSLALIFPLSVGEFDLSIASNLGLGAILLGSPLQRVAHLPLGVSIVIVLIVGAIVGAVNGLFIVGLGVNAFIVTSERGRS